MSPSQPPQVVSMRMNNNNAIKPHKLYFLKIKHSKGSLIYTKKNVNSNILEDNK